MHRNPKRNQKHFHSNALKLSQNPGVRGSSLASSSVSETDAGDDTRLVEWLLSGSGIAPVLGDMSIIPRLSRCLDDEDEDDLTLADTFGLEFGTGSGLNVNANSSELP